MSSDGVAVAGPSLEQQVVTLLENKPAGWVAEVAALIAQGADCRGHVRVGIYSDCTLLDWCWAEAKDHPEVFRLLLAAGADPRVRYTDPADGDVSKSVYDRALQQLAADEKRNRLSVKPEVLELLGVELPAQFQPEPAEDEEAEQPQEAASSSTPDPGVVVARNEPTPCGGGRAICSTCGGEYNPSIPPEFHVCLPHGLR
jgi:hypothetical protein